MCHMTHDILSYMMSWTLFMALCVWDVPVYAMYQGDLLLKAAQLEWKEETNSTAALIACIKGPELLDLAWFMISILVKS